MLHASLEQINQALLAQVCQEQWPETGTLDFKALPPKRDDKDREEFRKDLCALANADGGDIVYGISTKDDKACAIMPIASPPFDALKRTMLQLLESRIEPPLPSVQFREVKVDDGYVIVLRVPASYVGPHRCGPPAAERFVMRVDSRTADFSYTQLRDAFGRGNTLLEAAAKFRDARVTKLKEGRTPIVLPGGAKMAVHIIPLCGIAGRARVDIRSLQDDPRILMRRDDFMNWRRWPSLEGIVMYPHDEGAEDYQVMFRQGAFEVAAQASTVIESEQFVVADWAGPLLRTTLATYAAAAPSFNVNGPAMVSMSLCGVAGMRMLCGGSYRRPARREPSEDLIVLPEVIVEDVASQTLDIDAATKPIMDVLYQCFGEHSCPHYDAAGKWKGPD